MNKEIDAVKRLIEGDRASEEIEILCRAILNIDERLGNQFANDKELLREIQTIKQQLQGR